MFYSIKERANKLISMFNKLDSGQGRLYSLANNQTGTGIVCLLLYCTVNFDLSNSLTRPQADVDDNDMGKYNI